MGLGSKDPDLKQLLGHPVSVPSFPEQKQAFLFISFLLYWFGSSIPGEPPFSASYRTQGETLIVSIVQGEEREAQHLKEESWKKNP